MIKKYNYPWTRYWIPHGHTPAYDRFGYFESPDILRFGWGNEKCVTLSRLEDVPCLVLLGEPGSGKSHEMLAEFERRQKTDSDQNLGNISLFLNLGAYNTRTDLEKTILQNPEFLHWKNAAPENSSGPLLSLFLDSLDEGLIEIRNLMLILEEIFKPLPAERLRLRISCRSAEWPHYFSDVLANRWKTKDPASHADDPPTNASQAEPPALDKPKPVQIYELAPLRRTDVDLAATGYGLQENQFVEAVEAREIVPLAMLPITLTLLLKLAEESKKVGSDFELPRSRLELYQKGLLHLCAEPAERENAGHAGSLRAPQKLSIASRLAALCIFSGHSALYVPRDERLELTPPPERQHDLQLAQAQGGNEPIRDFGHAPNTLSYIEVMNVTLRETINTGLFSGRGEGSIGWTHQTFAEFLAAEFILRHDMTLPQIVSLFTTSEGGIAPQLIETAAWLAMRHEEFRHWLLGHHPDVFQRSDAALLDENLRASIIDALLNAIEHDQARAHDIDYHHAAKLTHPNIASQLRSWIESSNHSQNARIGASKLAGICCVNDLASDLAARALDGNEIKPVRLYTGSALLSMAEEKPNRTDEVSPVVSQALQSLMPLAQRLNGDGTPTNDATDDLKALGLRAVWPHHISIQDILPLLDTPDDEQPSHDYERFISYGFAEKLKPEHLSIALRWARHQSNLAFSGHSSQTQPLPSRNRSFQSASSSRGFLLGEISGQNLFEDIARKAWENFSEPGVARSFARLAIQRLNYHQEVFGHDHWSVMGQAVTKLPFETLLHQQTSEAIAKRRLLVCAVGRVLRDWNPAEPEHPLWCAQRELFFNYIFKLIVAEDKEWLRQRAANTRISPKARNLAQWLLAQQEEKESNHAKWRVWPQPQPVLLCPTPLERIQADLNDFENGDVEAWGRLNFDLALKPDSPILNINGITRPECDDKKVQFGDLTQLPAWQTLDEEMHFRIFSAALAFLNQVAPLQRMTAPYGHSLWYFDAYALGYRALRLLINHSPRHATQITTALWAKWAPAVVYYDPGETVLKIDPHAVMVRHALENAPDQSLDALADMWEKNLKWGYLKNPGILSQCWQSTQRPRLERFLLDFLQRTNYTPDVRYSVRHTLFNMLFEQGVEEAEDFAWKIVIEPSDESLQVTKERLQAASLLLVNGRKNAWGKIWPLLEKRQIRGRALAHACAWGRRRHEEGVNAFSATDLEHIYRLLRRIAKPERDRQRLGMRTVKSRDEVAHLRNEVFLSLGHRGELEDFAAMERIIKDFPQDEKLKDDLNHVRQQRRRRVWQPIEPAHLLELARDPQRRVVRNGDELLEVLQASLMRLEIKLQRGTPAAVDLWNELKWSQITKIFLQRVTNDVPQSLQSLKTIIKAVKTAQEEAKKKNPKPKIMTDPIFLMPREETRLSDYLKRFFDEDLKQRRIVVNREVEVRPVATGVGTRTDLWVEISGENGPIVVIVEIKGCWHSEVRTAMESQLRDQYLVPLNLRHGLFVVGWFECEAWCRADTRHDAVPKTLKTDGAKSRVLTLEEMREELQLQAQRLSDPTYQIQSFVLDTRWPL